MCVCKIICNNSYFHWHIDSPSFLRICKNLYGFKESSKNTGDDLVFGSVQILLWIDNWRSGKNEKGFDKSFYFKVYASRLSSLSYSRLIFALITVAYDVWLATKTDLKAHVCAFLKEFTRSNVEWMSDASFRPNLLVLFNLSQIAHDQIMQILHGER